MASIYEKVAPVYFFALATLALMLFSVFMAH